MAGLFSSSPLLISKNVATFELIMQMVNENAN
jgi:hypothetical protein